MKRDVLKVSIREFLRELWDFCGTLILILLILFFLDIGSVIYWELIAK